MDRSQGDVLFVLGRRPALDGLRGVAILGVLGAHTAGPLLQGGSFGVDLFFVLSGFLITALLLQEHRSEGKIRLGRFYLRRALRLLPALLAVLLVCGACIWFWGDRTAARAFLRDLPSVLFYYYNFHLIHRAGHGLPWCPCFITFWSLAIEEQFYLVWPATLAALLALKARRRWVVAVALLGVGVPAVVRAVSWTHDPLRDGLWLYYGTAFRADALSAGCLLALLAAWWGGPKSWQGRLALRGSAWAAAAFLALFLVMAATLLPRLPFLRLGHVFTLMAAACGLVIGALLWSRPRLLAGALEWRPLRWAGRISYGAYLWNAPIVCLNTRLLGAAPPWAQNLLVVGGSLAAGALSHYLVERPFLRLKERLTAKPQGAPARAERPLAA